MLKRIVSGIKNKNNFVTFCFYLVKIHPASDQFNIIMFDNIYVKHKPSIPGHKKILINGTLRGIDITLKILYFVISKVNLIMSVCATVCIKTSERF